jgi:hypothetical protein
MPEYGVRDDALSNREAMAVVRGKRRIQIRQRLRHSGGSRPIAGSAGKTRDRRANAAAADPVSPATVRVPDDAAGRPGESGRGWIPNRTQSRRGSPRPDRRSGQDRRCPSRTSRRDCRPGFRDAAAPLGQGAEAVGLHRPTPLGPAPLGHGPGCEWPISPPIRRWIRLRRSPTVETCSGLAVTGSESLRLTHAEAITRGRRDTRGSRHSVGSANWIWGPVARGSSGRGWSRTEASFHAGTTVAKRITIVTTKIARKTAPKEAARKSR